jgi:hypothetical protein
MTLPDSQAGFSIVVFTNKHSITGELSLKDKRLSDYMNDPADSMLTLRNVSLSRFDEPGKILHQSKLSVLPKAGIVLLFEAPGSPPLPSHRFFGFVETLKYDVFLVLDGMEITGVLHTHGSMDFRRFLAVSADAFLPITQAKVVLGASHNLVVQMETVLVNSEHIRFMGQIPPAPLTPAIPTGKTQPTPSQ